MSDVRTEQPDDFQKVPYDASLAFKEPSESWRRMQALKGTNSTVITDTQVPGADLIGEWVVITGSNNGVGHEAAFAFAKWVANLILACREPPVWETKPIIVLEECKALVKAAGHQSDMEVWLADISDLESVESFARRWLETGRPLDVLCNNADMGNPPSASKVHRTKDGFEFIHQVNFLSHVLITLSLLPSLAKASMPRIVCATSCHQFFGRYDLINFNSIVQSSSNEGSHYGNNKLCYQIWITEFQQRLLQVDRYKYITVNGVHPGYVNTGIWNKKGPKRSLPWLEYFFKALAFMLAINASQEAKRFYMLQQALSVDQIPRDRGWSQKRAKVGAGISTEYEKLKPCLTAEMKLRDLKSGENSAKS